MIYPIIRNNNFNGEAVKADALYVSGDCPDLAQRAFEQNGIALGGDFEVEIKIADTRKTTYIDEISVISDEKYIIEVAADKALVQASSEKGVFRALNTLCKLIANNELKQGTCEDYPLFATRGYIEGFYGTPWSHQKRISVMTLMAKKEQPKTPQRLNLQPKQAKP